MKIKICAATDCTNKITSGSARKLYCSDRCRYRQNKRVVSRNRAMKGLCIQCGGEHDAPTSRIKSKDTPKYCSKCQEYFANHYKAKGENKQ